LRGSEEEPAILSNSPQVRRLLRQPSGIQQQEEIIPVFTPDASFRFVLVLGRQNVSMVFLNCFTTILRQETSGFGRLDDMFLKKVPCIYAEEFAGHPHLVFLSPSGVVSIMTEKMRNCFAVVVFDSKVGYCLF
jgi:hypothetical protein